MNNGVDNLIGYRRFSSLILCGLLLWVLGTANSAKAQGFMVAPMKVELYPRPGDEVEQQVRFRNTTGRAMTITVTPLLLSQTEQSASDPIEPDSPRLAGLPNLRSCYKWLKVDANSLDIPSLETRSIAVKIKVPLGVRGFYGACLVVENKLPAEPARGIGIVMRFIIPILLQVQGAPARERFLLFDAGMQHVDAVNAKPATTVTFMKIRNEGETLCRLEGHISVLYPAGKLWRQVAEISVPEFAILPGVTLNLQQDLRKRFPSGHYKVIANLQVSGQRKALLERELDFQGDPTVTAVAADVPIAVQPLDVTIKAVPGSRRSAVITLSNPTDETVQVTGQLQVPNELAGVTMGTVSGDDYCCTGWLSLSPNNMTLRGGERRSIRVVLDFPVDVKNPNYYANLLLHVAYLDGQNAGDTLLPVWVSNTQLPSECKGEAMALTIVQQAGDQYEVSAKFANTGNIHFAPSVSAMVVTQKGDVYALAKLEPKDSRIIPLATPYCVGVMDFANVPAGEYDLIAKMDYGGIEPVSIYQTITVEVKDGQRQVTVQNDAVAPSPAANDQPEDD